MKHPDARKVYLFLVFSVGFLIALGFGSRLVTVSRTAFRPWAFSTPFFFAGMVIRVVGET